MALKKNGNSLVKVILTDLAGIGCLILVPFLGPLPGPGGLPLLIAGFGLLAANHDWADDAITYIKNQSDSMRTIVFPDRKWIKLAWDIFAVVWLAFGWWLNMNAESLLVVILSIGIMASSSTVLMFNRNRLDWLDKSLRRTGKK